MYILRFTIHTVYIHSELSLLLRILFFADILFNFRTTFVNKKGEVVSDSKTIAFNYLKSWFVVDLFAALPFDLLYASDVYSGDVSISLQDTYVHVCVCVRASVWACVRLCACALA